MMILLQGRWIVGGNYIMYHKRARSWRRTLGFTVNEVGSFVWFWAGELLHLTWFTFWESLWWWKRQQSSGRTASEEKEQFISMLTSCLLWIPKAIIICTIHLAINHVLPFDNSFLCLNAIYIFLLVLCLRIRQEVRPAMGQPSGRKGCKAGKG